MGFGFVLQWVADGSPTHSTAVRIENSLQFVPKGTDPKEFKKLQQLVSKFCGESLIVSFLGTEVASLMLSLNMI
jgi:hypothetical protein